MPVRPSGNPDGQSWQQGIEGGNAGVIELDMLHSQGRCRDFRQVGEGFELLPEHSLSAPEAPDKTADKPVEATRIRKADDESPSRRKQGGDSCQ